LSSPVPLCFWKTVVGRRLSVASCQKADGRLADRCLVRGTAGPSARSELLGRDDKSWGGQKAVVGCQLSVVRRENCYSFGGPQIPPLGLKSSVGMTNCEKECEKEIVSGLRVVVRKSLYRRSLY
jgi:hypothetical protein